MSIYAEQMEDGRQLESPPYSSTEPETSDGGMPGFGGVFGKGLWIGFLGGIACNFWLMSVWGFGWVLNNFQLPPSLMAFFGYIGAALGLLLLGSIVAAVVGLPIGALSATLMWLTLSLLPWRDERTRWIVGLTCAFIVALCAAIFISTGLDLGIDRAWNRGMVFSSFATWVVLIDMAIVTLTGGWFAVRHLKRKEE